MLRSVWLGDMQTVTQSNQPVDNYPPRRLRRQKEGNMDIKELLEIHPEFKEVLSGCNKDWPCAHYENMDEWRQVLKDNGFTEEEIEEEEAKSEFYYAGGEDFVEVYN